MRTELGPGRCLSRCDSSALTTGGSWGSGRRKVAGTVAAGDSPAAEKRGSPRAVLERIEVAEDRESRGAAEGCPRIAVVEDTKTVEEGTGCLDRNPAGVGIGCTGTGPDCRSKTWSRL